MSKKFDTLVIVADKDYTTIESIKSALNSSDMVIIVDYRAETKVVAEYALKIRSHFEKEQQNKFRFINVKLESEMKDWGNKVVELVNFFSPELLKIGVFHNTNTSIFPDWQRVDPATLINN